ncbi:MAG TPA: DUF6599 family protein [Terriglobales bacterium]|nr:DUF6599 family protein [Terriglobales bacterium]
MKLSKLIPALVLVISLAGVALADEAASSVSILPKQFGGWQISGSSRTSNDPAIADPVNAAVLKEYGFTSFESATYTRDDGRKLTLKAARFADASGAYGAYTYYKTPAMLIEKIGDGAASMNERVLFYRGNILVDVVFQKLSAMSAAELRELAESLPLPSGNTRNLPGLPAYLPTQSYVKNTAKYVVGPTTLQNLDAPVPAELVDFNAGAEVIIGNYNSSGGEATLMLISYPTPQIAADHLRRIEAARPQGSQSASGAAAANANPILLTPIFDKRTGPIVVVAAGPLSQAEAKSLLASVNYDANVTWNENTYFTKRDNLANLLVNVIILCFIIIGFALVAGVAFGGIRILAKRLFPDRVFDQAQNREFISLHLSEKPPEP